MDNEDKALTFSEQALLNRSLFLSQFNDINIYVEDVGKEYEYEEIFERLFDDNDNLYIFSIFPLGGKDAIIKAHKAKGLYDTDGKLNIFLVDGDFDNLWSDPKIISSNLIYLTRYNIESYYCTKEAVIQFMRSFLKCPRKEAERKTHFDEWHCHVRVEIGKLFILFAVANHYCPELPNVKLGPGKFLDKNGHLIIEKYSEYYELLSQKVNDIDTYIDEVYRQIQDSFKGNKDEKIFSIICGKFQFESLCRQLAFYCHKNINRENFRSKLISTFDLEPLGFLKEQILSLI